MSDWVYLGPALKDQRWGSKDSDFEKRQAMPMDTAQRRPSRQPRALWKLISSKRSFAPAERS